MSITLSVPPAIVQEARAFAERRGTSLNQLIRDYLADVVTSKAAGKVDDDEFDRLVESEGVTLKKPYRFRRQDAYEEEIG